MRERVNEPRRVLRSGVMLARHGIPAVISNRDVAFTRQAYAQARYGDELLLCAGCPTPPSTSVRATTNSSCDQPDYQPEGCIACREQQAMGRLGGAAWRHQAHNSADASCLALAALGAAMPC